MTDRVIKPLVLVRDERGATQYLYMGAEVPSYVNAERRKVLRDEGYIAAEGSSEPVAATGPAPVQPKGNVGAGDGPPAKTASKAEWVDYAVAKGVSRDEAEKSSKDELVSKHGS